MVVRPTIVAAYKTKWGKKVKLKVFNDLPCPDKILSNRSRLLPEGADILELGVGENFIKRYKKKFKI